MAKPDPTPPAEETITMSKAELHALIAEAAAGTAVRATRDNLALEGATMAAERRTSLEMGSRIPDRKPWPTERAHARYEAHGWAGPVDFDVLIKVQDRDEDGQPMDPPRRTVTHVIDWKLPPIEKMQAAHSFDDNATFAAEGFGGKSRPDIKKDVKFTIHFLQLVVKDVYEKPLLALFQGKDIKFVKPYLTGDPVAVDLGEIRRDNAGAINRRVA